LLVSSSSASRTGSKRIAASVGFISDGLSLAGDSRGVTPLLVPN
jgi:hypothetical protein